MTITARFAPQAWVNDQAIDVDPEGQTEWDATVAFDALPAEYRDELARDALAGEMLDRHDMLKTDEHAPEWVRAWRGPFSIWLRAQ